MSEISVGLGPDMAHLFYDQQELIIAQSPSGRGAARTIEKITIHTSTEAFLPEGIETDLSFPNTLASEAQFDKWGDPVFANIPNSSREEATVHFGLEY